MVDVQMTEDQQVIVDVILTGVCNYAMYNVLRQTFTQNETRAKLYMDYVMRQQIRPHLQSSAGRRFSTSTIDSLM